MEEEYGLLTCGADLFSKRNLEQFLIDRLLLCMYNHRVQPVYNEAWICLGIYHHENPSRHPSISYEYDTLDCVVETDSVDSRTQPYLPLYCVRGQSFSQFALQLEEGQDGVVESIVGFSDEPADEGISYCVGVFSSLDNESFRPHFVGQTMSVESACREACVEERVKLILSSFEMAARNLLRKGLCEEGDPLQMRLALRVFVLADVRIGQRKVVVVDLPLLATVLRHLLSLDNIWRVCGKPAFRKFIC